MHHTREKVLIRQPFPLRLEPRVHKCHYPSPAFALKSLLNKASHAKRGSRHQLQSVGPNPAHRVQSTIGTFERIGTYQRSIIAVMGQIKARVIDLVERAHISFRPCARTFFITLGSAWAPSSRRGTQRQRA